MRTRYERLAHAAASIREDLALVKENLWTLPLLLGDFRWFRYVRYCYGRPKSELSIALYGKDLFLIVIRTLYTAPLLLLFIVAVLASLPLYDLSVANPRYFSWARVPFVGCLVLLEVFLHRSEFEIERPEHDPRIYVCETNGVCQEEIWYFVNGIMVSPAMASGTADILKDMTGRTVIPLVNPSLGAGVDLAECILGRTLDVYDAATTGVLEEVRGQLKKGRKVVLLGHSQGGIIISNVVLSLVQEAENKPDVARSLHRLEVYTFGSGADHSCGFKDEKTQSMVPFAEHFGAEMDIVFRLGALTFSGTLARRCGHNNKSSEWSGKVYTLKRDQDCNGHLMKEHILPALRAGLFGTKSQFVRKYCRNSWEEVPSRN